MPNRSALDQPARAFISYSRVDGEQFARRLRARLEHEQPEIKLWQDRTDLTAGDWWRQITEALHQVAFLVLVMTSKAASSENIAKEWHYARQQGVGILPILADPLLRIESLPRWMRKTQFFKLDHDWEIFVQSLKGRPTCERVPFMVPDLPAGSVQRPDEFDQLLNLLLAPDHRDPVAITTALLGAGGLGKTTLAIALCQDERVVSAFDDGILWVTLGERPDVRAGLAKLYAALTGERPAFYDEEDAASQVAEKLGDKNCLIVIDDVWNRAHLRPFLRGGSGCTRLITTRLTTVAADSKRVDVDTMTGDAAVALLTAKLEVCPLEPAAFRGLALRLGEWPLLLGLARDQIQELLVLLRGDLSAALDHLNQLLNDKGITALNVKDESDRRRSFHATMEISLDLLDAAERRHYGELAIFPEDTGIPLTTVSALWGMKPLDAKELALRLAACSLVKFDSWREAVLLHDVIRTYLAEQLDDLTTTGLNASLIGAWGDPYRLPDAYAWDQFARHLLAAGRRDRLRQFLVDPVWMAAKLSVTGPSALVKDYSEFLEDADLRLIQGAIQLSAHALVGDGNQLGGQLLGRLLAYESPVIRDLLDQVDAHDTKPRLRPLLACLHPPGSSLLRTLLGHTDDIEALALMPDGHRVLSASYDQTLRLWDLETGATLHILKGHADVVWSVAVTPDGSRAVSGSKDRSLRVWDLASGAADRTLAGHTSEVYAVAVTPDGRHVVSGSRDGTLRVWELATGAMRRVLEADSSSVLSVAVAPDGRHAISGSEDGRLRVWDLKRGRKLQTLKGHRQGISAVALVAGPLDLIAVSASFDGTLKIWDVAAGRLLKTLAAHRPRIRTMAATRDGSMAISGAEDGTLSIWDLKRGVAVRTFQHNVGWVLSVAIMPDGRRALSGGADKSLQVWDLTTATRSVPAQGHSGVIWALAMLPDGQRIVTASADATLRIWDSKRGTAIRVLQGHQGEIFDLKLLWHGTHAITTSHDRTLKLWDLDAGRPVRVFHGHSGRVFRIAISADEQIVVSSSEDASIRVWDLKSGAMLRTLSCGYIHAYGVVILPDGHRVVTGSANGTLTLWNLDTGKEIRSFQAGSSAILAIRLTEGGSRVLAAGGDATLLIWDVESGTSPGNFEGHSGNIWSTAVLPDGRRAVSASQDCTIRVWDIETRRQVATFHGDSMYYSCAIASDGTTILAGDATGQVSQFRLEG
jgi:WD40 repeat protein